MNFEDMAMRPCCGRRSIWPYILAFVLGGLFVASLDYGDVWICTGDCDGMIEAIRMVDTE